NTFIRNLAKEFTFDELMVSLTYFVMSWRGEAKDKYGYSLKNFVKNLDVIQAEATQFGKESTAWDLRICGLWDKWGKYLKYIQREELERSRNIRNERETLPKTIAEFGMIELLLPDERERIAEALGQEGYVELLEYLVDATPEGKELEEAIEQYLAIK